MEVLSFIIMGVDYVIGRLIICANLSGLEGLEYSSEASLLTDEMIGGLQLTHHIYGKPGAPDSCLKLKPLAQRMYHDRVAGSC